MWSLPLGQMLVNWWVDPFCHELLDYEHFMQILEAKNKNGMKINRLMKHGIYVYLGYFKKKKKKKINIFEYLSEYWLVNLFRIC